MPNKDSFTFSDKLRKSKSVPLSKRLPSIVGGKNTQKRTLVQRAQRDLPFILVAALALLLLPFLSRTGSDDIASTENIAWNTLTDAPSFAEGGGADIMPAGTMKDPLDWIIGARNDVKDSDISAGDSAKSAYGSESSSTSRSSRYGTGTGSDDGSSYGRSGYSSYSSSSKTKKPAAKSDYNTNKSYDESYITKKTTKKPATAKYGQKTRAGVRKSFERKATDINRALRISQMPGQRGAANVSHNLPIGQGPNRGSASNPREGIRPVALQPMEAKGGIGRSMTGENLYAEAARSIREMNAGGPAKQNLLAAQMRDVDGKLTPEGLGGPGAGASVRPGAGGNGPGNNNGYNIGKPWWWDMMQARSQKMWDLLYYKPREIFWNNIYNYLSQLMNCLATGNRDGDVSTMFGKKAGASDYICVKDGKAILDSASDFAEMFSNTRTSTDKDKNKETNADMGSAFESYRSLCESKGGTIEIDPSSDKGFWQVRAECVGLGVMLKRLKSRIKHTQYDSNCLGVNSDPMSFTLDISRANARGKHNTRREQKLAEKTVIALLAKVKDGPYKGKEIVVYAQQGNTLSKEGSNFGGNFNATHENCTLSRLVAFTSRRSVGRVERRISRYNAHDVEEYAGFSKSFDKETGEEVGVSPVALTEDGVMFPAFSIIPEQGQITAANKICTVIKNDEGEVTGFGENNAEPLTLDELRSRAELGKEKKYAECDVWEAKPDRYAKKINGEPCEECCERPIDIKQTTEFEATINNTKDKHVFAVLVDQIDQETEATVTYIVDFGTGERGSDGSFGLKKCDKNGNCHFQFTVNVASLGLVPNDYLKTVATGYGNAGNSSRSSTDNTQANELTSNEIQELNRVNQPLQNNCIENHCYKLYPEVSEKQSACIQQCKNAYPVRTGNYQGDSNSSSSGSNVQTARGSGIIFWIVTGKNASLKVKLGDKVGQTIHDVKIGDLINLSETAWYSVCRYRWCDDIGSCGVPQRPSPKDYCVEDGKAYLAQKIPLDKQDIYIKVKDLGPASGISIEDLPPCVILCHDPDGTVHICDKDGEPEEGEPVCPLSQIPEEYRPLVPPCPGCCTYTTSDGVTNNYESIEVDGKHYIVDARPSNCKNTKNHQCTPAAWSKENGRLFVYDMSTYDPKCLKFIPGESAEPFRTCTGTGGEGCPQVELTELDPEPFTLIHDQSYQMEPNLDPNKPGTRPYDPHYFELFPQLTLLKDIEVDLSACYFCGKSLYDNADVRAKAEVISEIDGRLRECFERIKELEAMGATESVKQLKTIYFYGYASKRGSHDAYELPGKGGKGTYNVGCITSGANVGFNDDDDIRWGYCNKSLSQDRSLYIMYKLLTEKQLARDYDIGVDEESTRIFENLRGFTNTLPKKGDVISYTGKKPSYRLNKKYYPKGDGEEYTFISKPCGSDGAAEVWDADLDVQEKDRLVLIAPIGSPDYNGCFPKRMTCGDENADVEKALAKIAEDIKKELRSKRRSVSVANRTAPIPSIMNFVTESDENFITNEEMAEIQNYGKNGPLSNGELAINDEDYGGKIKTTAVHNRNNSEEEITPEQQALLDAYNDVSGLNF